MKELLLAAVASLPEPERDVYQLRDLENISGEETAVRLGISLVAMKSRLHRARAGVRRHLDKVLAPHITREIAL
jgi:RNA polymerase sigma-70 factor (ECF subfamily)